MPQIQATLPDKAALIAYQVSDSSTYIFVVTKSDFAVIPTDFSLELLNTQTQLLRKNLSDYTFLKNNLELSYMQFTQPAHWL